MCIYKWTLVSFARTGRTRMSASPTSTWRCLPLPQVPSSPRSQQIVERNKRANSSIKRQRKSQIILMAIAWMIDKKKNYTKTATTTRQIDKQQKKGERASATCGNWQPHEFNTQTLCMQHANGPTTTPTSTATTTTTGTLHYTLSSKQQMKSAI